MRQVYLAVAVVLVHTGIDVYTGYKSFVVRWGDVALIESPLKLEVVGPSFNAFGESDIETQEG
jgi:hypothetical protein